MKKKPTVTNDLRANSRPLSGRFTPREASPHAKLATKKPAIPKKTRYVTPNPFSPKSSKNNPFSKECTIAATRAMIDKGSRPLLSTREKSPRKLVTLPNDPLSKISNIINSPRNSELRYADAMGTRSLTSGIGGIKPANTVNHTNAIKASLKENENLKKIREIMSKNRRTKSTGTAGALLPSKGPIAAQHRPMPSSGGAKLAWEKEEEAKHLNININNNYNGNSININIVNRHPELMGRAEPRPIAGLDQKLSIDNILKKQAQKGKKEQVTGKPGTFSHTQVPPRPQSTDGRKTPSNPPGKAASRKDPPRIPGRNLAGTIVFPFNHLQEIDTDENSRFEIKDLDRVPSTAALISPKYIKKPIIPSKAIYKPPEPKLIDTKLVDPVLCFAAKTRAGCLPTKVQKTNQDSYITVKHLGNIKNLWMFGVFDGHGINGHFASDHIKQYLPTNMELADYISAKKASVPDGNFLKTKGAITSGLLSENAKARNEIIKGAFLKTNQEIRNRSFNISFSGSTAVTILFLGDKLVCANVGDSRAILASYKTPKSIKNIQLPAEFADLPEDEKIWLALPLSRDHKPDDEEEYKRIMEANGRVEPFKEPNGEAIGPYRVWLKDENIPGLAMSRSLGDKVASQVGVISDPEIYEMTLTKDDKFIIIASDGIWEFLPNDQVVEMVVPYWEANDPEGACDKLISEAVYHWQNEDEVIDDITLIVIFLSLPNSAA